MCVINGQYVSREEYIRIKEMQKEWKDYEHFNIAVNHGYAYGNTTVLRATADKSDFEILQMEWGFIPSHLLNRDEAAAYRRQYMTLNARGEEMLQPRKTYRDAALNRRCLILSSGYSESRHIYRFKKNGERLKTPDTYPYKIKIAGAPYFYMAGIWNPWTDRETGETVNTVAMVTAPANDLLKQIHNSMKRMPVILNDIQAYEWIFDDLTEEQITKLAGTRVSSRDLDYFTIAKEFRKAGDMDMPFEYNGLPPVDEALIMD